MCTITLSAQKAGCKTVGGIKQIYLIDKAARLADDAITYTVTDGAITIAGVEENTDAYLIEPRQNTWGFTQPATDDNTAGTSFVTQTLTGIINGYTASLVTLSNNIRKGKMEALIVMRSGTMMFAGLDPTGLESNGGDMGATGTAIGDTQGFTFTLTSEAVESAPVLATLTNFLTAFNVVEAA